MDLGVFQRTNSFGKLSGICAKYGVQVNAVPVDKVFALYQKTGFLYPGKAARLRPHWARISENWRRMMHGDNSLLSVLTAGDESHGYASLAVWRTTLGGCVLQHLVSENNPLASRAVMLACGAASIYNIAEESAQNWFRPENRFPARVFGSMVQSVGDDASCVQRYSYFAFPRRLSILQPESISVVPYDPSQREALCSLAAAERGAVYVAGEDLCGDVNCELIDELYQRVGLRRQRQVWLAYRKNNAQPIGAAIAYRGPLGINFSYLENRCDLLISKSVPLADVTDVVSSLLHASSAAYGDFELDDIPVIADENAVYALMKVGAQFLRHYRQGTCLRDGYSKFFGHIDGFYSKLLARNEKQSTHAAVVGAQL